MPSKKIPFLIVAILITAQSLRSQGSIYITPAGNLFINSGTLFFADSLALLPSLNFNITGENTVTRNTTVTHATANPYIKRVFHFLSTTASFDGDISIYYTDADLNGIAENALTLNIHNGAAWNAFVTGVIRDGVNNVVTTTGLSNITLNELTLASLSAPLPVQFTFFNAACSNGNVILTWQTAQEINSKFFEIQTSINGNNWQVIGTLPAAGNSTTLLNYSFTHTNAIANNLYRIAEYDIDGKSVFSTTLRAACSTHEEFMAYPNPVQAKAIVTINLNAATALNLKLYDIKGALVKVVQKNVLRGVSQVEIDMNGLAAGTYTLTAQWGNSFKHILLIKQ